MCRCIVTAGVLPRFLVAAIVLLAGTAAPEAVAQNRSSQNSASLSLRAEKYLEAALDTMQTHSMYRDSVDWASLRTEAFERAEGAQMPADTYPAIRYALSQIDDHSGFMGAQKARQWANGRESEDQDGTQGAGTAEIGPPPRGHLVRDAIGYVRVPAIKTGDEARKTARADSLQAIIARLDRSGSCGWIVDLRGNEGGNMWPMLAGLGPLFREGRIGKFEASGAPWIYRDGKAMVGENPKEAAQAEVSGDPYRLDNPQPPVAVLIGENTASSGEAVAIAFQKRPDTRTFGTPTSGFTTSNGMFELSDGARMFLATGVMADRTGTRYIGPITPDVRVEQSGVSESRRKTLREDPVINAATTWLEKRHSCPG